MENQSKFEFTRLQPGLLFPPASYKIDPTGLEAYLTATGDDDPVYNDVGHIPPTAVAARAMAALAEGITLPPGTIHISQELEFLAPVQAGETLTSRAMVIGRRSRGKLELLTIEIRVSNQDNKEVMTGRSTFMTPQS